MINHKKLLVAGVLLGSLGLSGCIVSVGDDIPNMAEHTNWQDREYQNREHLSQLQLGMSVTEVAMKMGVADFNEAYQQAGTPVQVLFYRTQRVEDDGETTKEECTPLLFKNNLLQGWGNAAYQQYLSGINGVRL